MPFFNDVEGSSGERHGHSISTTQALSHASPSV
jgi:hypothetical protein